MTPPGVETARAAGGVVLLMETGAVRPALSDVLDGAVPMRVVAGDAVSADVEVVLVDARQGETVSAEICSGLCRDGALADRPIVVVVDGADPDVVAATLHAGADAVVEWAGGPAVVTAAIAAAVRVRRRHRDEQAVLRRDHDALAYAISHDLRAPLRSIDGFSAALVDSLSSDLDPKAADSLQRVRAATRRMALMIDGLLEVSRVGRASFARQTTDLSAAIRKAAATVGRRYTHTPAVTVADGVTAEVDQGLAARLFEHLLDNCWKFSARSPSPVVVVETASLPDGREYVVRDNGVGFDATYAAKLFRPFQRLHGAGDYPGVGTGLAIVHRIVERHGGRLSIDSTPGVGTTVRFTLAPGAPAAIADTGGDHR